MIFTDRTITVRKGESRIDEPIVVYRGDYELEVRFTILNSRFKFMSGTNMIESEKASYGQLAILTPYGGNIFSDIVRCNDGSVTFVLTAEMLNQIEEVGLYSFQIRLMDYNKESRVSIPPIEFGIEVREPIASEDHDNSVNNAIVGYSIAKVVDPKKENVGDTFDESGNYNKTKWETGDRISEGKLNKIEDAVDKINQNEINNSASLSKRIDNNFSVLDSTKADKTYTDSLQNQLNNLVLGAVGDGNNAEVIQARGTFDVLNDRLDHSEEKIDSIVKEIWSECGLSVSNGFITTNGSVDSTSYHAEVSVTPGEKYSIKTNSGFQLKPYLFLDSNNTVVSYYNEYEDETSWHEYDLHVVTPHNACKIIINSFDRSFIGLKRYEFLKVDSDMIKELPNNIVRKENLSTDLSRQFIETYDPLTFSVKAGFMTIDGIINSYAGYHTALDVFSGERYKITTNYGIQMHAYVLVDTKGSVVEYAINDSASSALVKTFDVEVNVDGVLYVNTYASQYTRIQKFICYTIINPDNLLFERKVVFFGDSITHGSGSWADETTIRSKNKMTGYNFGVSGSQYTVRDDSDDSNNIYLRIISKYDEISDADYIIISGMVNDALRGMPIGTMTDYSDFECECDVSTVYGAYEKTIRYILENHGGVKLGVIITPNIPSSSSLNVYFDVVRDICKKYSVPVLDLYYNSGLCAGISTVRDLFYKGDNIHPNELGYEKYLNDKVEAFMKSL